MGVAAVLPAVEVVDGLVAVVVEGGCLVSSGRVPRRLERDVLVVVCL